MLRRLKIFLKLLKKAYISWEKNGAYARSATIAYYALFSLPSLLIIIVSIAGYFFGREAVQGRLTGEISQFIGEDTANAVESMIENAALTQDSTWTVIFGFSMLIFGATGVFFQLKIAMNNIWNVAAKKTNLMRLILDRVISLGMVFVLGLLLLIAMVVSALLHIVSEKVENFFPDVTEFMVDIANYLLSFLIITTLFAAIFKLLPDIKIRIRTTYVGAALTSVLFLIGESLISFYFGQSSPGSVYGGASSVVLILLWVYFTCLILFFGAEFTVQYALVTKEKVVPNRFGEPAIYQEMEKLEQRKMEIEDEKQILDKLKSHLDFNEKEENKDN
ncbi:YihY/virulence factor BrkB family protein [Christiangramia sabulilitoris]|uniref:YihY/virulence factor BrkB family protein n=1 Tax=Christiangramia sabulilitoris TaxID=2583991 RepID=A0A550I6J0_9FLAO|nr:YihY/virulence factor BrkB family protein [Christiangramia sabulilitoris]TRO66571.1 YihY/virulence factor BrkB family protein [Christiangramia sabulilitoris]